MTKTILRFYNEYIEPIKNGSKTDTWRRGDKSADYERDQTVDLIETQNDTNFGKAKITEIILTTLADVDDKTWQTRGYKSKDDFIASFQPIYPDIQTDETMTIIHFAYINDTSEP